MAQRCGVCGHNHEQMTFTAYDFTVQRFDCLGQDGAVAGTVTALERANLALWTFIKILRGRIFPNMSKVLSDDPMSRHLVAFVGDGPMGVARWRPASEESGSQVAIIEYFGIVENKRRQGYARRFLHAVIEDIEAIYSQQPSHPQALVAYVPQNDSFAAMKLFQSAGFQPASQVEVVENNSFLRMRMAWGCSRS
ncbi:hypothetical protein PHPALM_15155 [Phytophthora palmivora]|uniref:N-acetyltransferase domain-containing protein n=1 Tax=Phytophthora palmivora TaxID=4796 RepID=A0A2P4WW86_9STRA|nr:hypothetical protein PHPALM_37911 [Phytophthora palmivora]POM68661.1 hypothetical protein PHPALM_15155 [Phytophthora palmivora]